MNEEDRKLWTERIGDYRSSGLTAVKWAEKNNISVYKLRYYINKFNKEKKQEINQETNQNLNKHKWAEIVPEKKVENKNSFSPIKVTIGDATIEIVPGFDQNSFRDIVEILSKC